MGSGREGRSSTVRGLAESEVMAMFDSIMASNVKPFGALAPREDGGEGGVVCLRQHMP